MFTGLIEEVGVLESVTRSASGGHVRIRALKVLEGIKLGDSVAVDGVCLTVTAFDRHGFTADIMPNTLEQTRIRQQSPGAKVHLERALRVGDRLGGHFVSGHVDGLSRVISVKPDGEAVRLRIERAKTFWAHVMHKGSIAINGVSLTIDRLSDEWIEVSLVLHTQGETAFGSLKAGELVNVESDMLLKYMHQMLTSPGKQDLKASGNESEAGNENGSVTMAQLRTAGFL